MCVSLALLQPLAVRRSAVKVNDRYRRGRQERPNFISGRPGRPLSLCPLFPLGAYPIASDNLMLGFFLRKIGDIQGLFTTAVAVAVRPTNFIFYPSPNGRRGDDSAPSWVLGYLGLSSPRSDMTDPHGRGHRRASVLSTISGQIIETGKFYNEMGATT